MSCELECRSTSSQSLVRMLIDGYGDPIAAIEAFSRTVNTQPALRLNADKLICHQVTRPSVVKRGEYEHKITCRVRVSTKKDKLRRICGWTQLTNLLALDFIGARLTSWRRMTSLSRQSQRLVMRSQVAGRIIALFHALPLQVVKPVEFAEA